MLHLKLCADFVKKWLFSSLFGLFRKRLLGALLGVPAPKSFLNMAFLHRCRNKNFSPFCWANPEINGVKVCFRQTDRQSHKILTPYIFF
jgi:hypothetical protein